MSTEAPFASAAEREPTISSATAQVSHGARDDPGRDRGARAHRGVRAFPEAARPLAQAAAERARSRCGRCSSTTACRRSSGSSSRTSSARDFTKTLWNLLLRDDDMSAILLRFIWNVPLKFKRKFVAAIDAHLSDRYPMFKGLSQGWPGQNGIPPYIRDAGGAGAGLRARQPGLPRLHEPRLQRARGRPLRLARGAARQAVRGPAVRARRAEAGQASPRAAARSRSTSRRCCELLGTGRFSEALELIESCNPLPDVTGRVCPQELQCQGVCTLTSRPIEIGQLEWFLPEREKLEQSGARIGRALEELRRPVGEGREAADRGGRLRPRRPHQRLSAGGRGLPGHRVRGLPRARRRAALRHSRVPPAQRADRRRGRARSGCSAASSSPTSSSARRRPSRT